MSGTWASDWALNDIVTVAEFRKSLGCVADSTLGIAATSFDFSGLPTTYAHLRIVAYLRGDVAALEEFVLMRFNNDSTAVYDYQSVSRNNATAGGAGSTGQTSAQGGVATAATSPANTFSPVVIDIPNYGNSTNFKVFTALSFEEAAVAAASLTHWSFAGIWRAAAAINRVTLFCGAGGNFVAGSRVSIYVMGS